MDETNISTIKSGLGTIANETYDYINNLLTNPSVIILLIVVVITYLIIFMTTGGTGDESNYNLTNLTNNSNVSSSSSNIIIIITISIFLVLVIINGYQYFIGVDIIAKLKNFFSGNPELDIIVDTSRANAIKAPVPEILLKKQVFNIPGNTYVYPDAKALCNAYGSRLATYKEIEDSYNEGGEWCNYGWSEGQMALFPTQSKTYDELQKIKGHENDCGRPGINGGYMANPALKFGVNCYGYKPRMTEQEETLMETEPIYPKTASDIAMEHRVDYWKNKLKDILVSPFNYNNWSKI